jgi:type VI protein secretion system component VasF
MTTVIRRGDYTRDLEMYKDQIEELQMMLTSLTQLPESEEIRQAKEALSASITAVSDKIANLKLEERECTKAIFAFMQSQDA